MIDSLLDTELRALGLPTGAALLVEGAAIDLPPPVQGLGAGALAAHAAAELPLSVLLGLSSSSAAASSVQRAHVLVGDETDALAARAGLRLLRITTDDARPGVVRVESSGAIRARNAQPMPTVDGVAAVELRFGEGAWAQLLVEGQLEQDRRLYLALTLTGGRLVPRLLGAIQTPGRLPLPDWASLRAGLPIAVWLDARLGVLAADQTAGARLVSLGTFLRLFRPALPPHERLAQAAKTGDMLDQLKGQLRALDPVALEAAANEAEATAQLLLAEVASLSARLDSEELRDDEPAAAQVHDWLLRRDDLESSYRVLAVARRIPSSLESLRAALDDGLTALHTRIGAYRFPDDPRLRTVAELEPLAWWGGYSQPVR